MGLGIETLVAPGLEHGLELGLGLGHEHEREHELGLELELELGLGLGLGLLRMGDPKGHQRDLPHVGLDSLVQIVLEAERPVGSIHWVQLDHPPIPAAPILVSRVHLPHRRSYVHDPCHLLCHGGGYRVHYSYLRCQDDAILNATSLPWVLLASPTRSGEDSMGAAEGCLETHSKDSYCLPGMVQEAMNRALHRMVGTKTQTWLSKVDRCNSSLASEEPTSVAWVILAVMTRILSHVHQPAQYVLKQSLHSLLPIHWLQECQPVGST